MRVTIMFHSGSGTTEAVARSLAGKLRPHAVECVDITAGRLPDPSRFDLLGILSWTFFLGLPPAAADFLDGLPRLPGKPAFILTTYGMMPGRALKLIGKKLTEKGLITVAAHAFHTPESYPVYIGKGWGSEGSPDARELAAFEEFTGAVRRHLEEAGSGEPRAATIRSDLFSRLIAPYRPEKAKKLLGTLSADPGACTRCGVCARSCPHGAIRMEPEPVFDRASCRACWICYNRCPADALRASAFAGTKRYRGPSHDFLEKLS